MPESANAARLNPRAFHPLPWEQIPDLGLYMDQVITIIGRTYQPIYGDEIKRYLSAPMINNYVKSRLIPRPMGKKYNREQIALLSMIVALKQVASMEEIRQMLSPENVTVEALYTAFCERFCRVIHSLDENAHSGADGLGVALDYAILASGYHTGCVATLETVEGVEDRK